MPKPLYRFDIAVIEKRFPYFEAGLKSAIGEHGELIAIAEGEELIRDGQYIKSFPLVIEGTVRVYRLDDDGRELLLYYLNPGEVCAMALTCCMGHIRSNIKAVAESPATVVRVPVPLLDQWMATYRTWKEFVMYAYRRRFDELLETIDGIAFMNMDSRLLKFFTDRYKLTNQTTFTGTHQDIALALNSSREVVSRLLKKLEQQRRIVIGRNKIDYSALV